MSLLEINGGKTNECDFPSDVLFEEDNKVSPLMSATKIWSDLKESIEDESLVKNLTVLLFVQVIRRNIYILKVKYKF